MSKYNDEIREINLSYLMLAQQMLKDDMDTAMLRLGVGKEMAGLIMNLTAAQILKMSSLGLVLGRFRFDEQMPLNLIGNYDKAHLMPQIHASILMLCQPVDELG